MVDISGSRSGPHHFPIKIVVSEDFCKPSFQRGVLQCFCRFLVFLVQNQAFQEGDGSHPLFDFFVEVVAGDVSTR